MHALWVPVRSLAGMGLADRLLVWRRTQALADEKNRERAARAEKRRNALQVRGLSWRWVVVCRAPCHLVWAAPGCAENRGHEACGGAAARGAEGGKGDEAHGARG